GVVQSPPSQLRTARAVLPTAALRPTQGGDDMIPRSLWPRAAGGVLALLLAPMGFTQDRPAQERPTQQPEVIGRTGPVARPNASGGVVRPGATEEELSKVLLNQERNHVQRTAKLRRLRVLAEQSGDTA